MWQTYPWYELILDAFLAGFGFFVFLLALIIFGRSLVVGYRFLREDWAEWYLQLKITLPPRLEETVEAICYAQGFSRSSDGQPAERFRKMDLVWESRPFGRMAILQVLTCLLLCLLVAFLLPGAWRLSPEQRLRLGEIIIFNSLGVSAFLLAAVLGVNAFVTSWQMFWLLRLVRHPDTRQDLSLRNRVASYGGQLFLACQAGLLMAIGFGFFYYFGPPATSMFQRVIQTLLG